MFDVTAATSTAALNSLYSSYSTYWAATPTHYTIVTLYNLWFDTTTQNSPTQVTCRGYYLFTPAYFGYTYYNAYFNYNPSTQQYSYVGMSGNPASSVYNGMVTNFTYTVFYPPYYYYKSTNIANIITTYSTGSSDFQTNVLNYYHNFPPSSNSVSNLGTLSIPKALNYKNPTNDVAKYCTAVSTGILGPGTYTYNVPSYFTSVEAVIIGGGGGGGGGAKRGTDGALSIYSGGGGGAGRMLIVRIDSPKYLSITVGAAGTGGAALSTVDYGQGNPGNAGGSSSVKNYNSSSGNSSDLICSAVAHGGGGGGGSYRSNVPTKNYNSCDTFGVPMVIGGSLGSYDYTNIPIANFTTVSTGASGNSTDLTDGQSSPGCYYWHLNSPGQSGGVGFTYSDLSYLNGFTLNNNAGGAGGAQSADLTQATGGSASGYGQGGGGAGGSTAGASGGNGSNGAVCIYFYT